MMLSRILIIGTKYGMFSEEHFDILRKIKLSPEFLASQLVFSQANNIASDFHLIQLDEILESMEIDEKVFNILLYKDQTQFRINDQANLMERI